VGTEDVRQIAVPAAARALSTLARIDYEDAFLVATESAADRTAEEWARELLERAPDRLRARLVSGWSALGLKLDGAGGSVLGWQVRRSTPDVVLLGADSRIGMPGELLFEREARGLLFATFVRHGNPVARALWARVEPTHVRIVRQVLSAA
jgi:hypothetical protein